MTGRPERNQTKRNSGTAYGVVIVDFAPKKIAEKIYQTNFQPAQ